MKNSEYSLDGISTNKFLTLHDEYLIFSTRQHWTVLLPPIILNIFLLFGLVLLASISSVLTPIYFFPVLLMALIVMSISLEILIKQLVEWFFHFYIITNRKIIEVAYRPMFSRIVHGVLLDQVRCTEVDVSSKGLISEIFNVGSVYVTFDRPTQEKIFKLDYIKDPRRAAMDLSDEFGMQPASVWFGNQAYDTQVLNE